MARQTGGYGFREEGPDMTAVPRSRPLQRCWDSLCSAGFQQRTGVFPPGCLVKIRSKEPASITLEKRLDAGDKIPASAIITAQVFFHDALIRRDELLMWALATFDLRLAANAFHPFVGTSRRIS